MLTAAICRTVFLSIAKPLSQSAVLRHFQETEILCICRCLCRKWKNRINLIHVNSALLSCSDTYRAQILDICAINDLSHNAAFNRTLPTIILAHHNYAELAAIQREALKPILAGLNVRAYLNGTVSSAR